jgi:BirA family transcriptional regulator, biotin operon repressor / biotin---[acetyl-CoA-carboxylase] ligase
MLACERLDTTDSTQREAVRRIVANGRHAGGGMGKPAGPEQGAGAFGLWTTHQTQGLASHGRRWQDSPSGGGLALSIAWQEHSAHANHPAWPIRWSLLAVSALEAAHPELSGRLGVKWPNDIMHHSAKLAGVLVSRHFIDGRWWCIAGIGINLVWEKPPQMDRPITDLVSLGVPNPDPEKIVSRMASTAAPVLMAEGPSEEHGMWRAEYGRRDVVAGMPVRVVHPTTNATIQTGVNRGIGPAGELILDVDGEQHFVTVGELSLRPVHGAVL